MSQSGTVRQRPGRTGYYAVYRAPDPAKGGTRQVWKRFDTETEAKRFLRRAVVAVEDGTHVAPHKLTLEEFVNGRSGEPGWLDHLDTLVTRGKLRPATVAQYRGLMTLHVLPRLGKVKLAELTVPKLDRLYADLLISGKAPRKKGGQATGLSGTSVHLIHVTISKALSDAVRRDLLVKNVAKSVTEAPQVASPEKTIWTPVELDQFLEAVRSDRLYGLWHMLATTGVRRGEAAGLRWEDVDLEIGELNIRRARVVVGYRVLDSKPKTEKGSRLIALDPATVTALRSHRARQAEERLLWGPAYNDSGLVFTTEIGVGIHPERITRGFARLVKKAGLPAITVHGVRHSYATKLADAGVSLEVISKRLGHSSVAITGDLYRHRTDASDRAAAQAGAANVSSDR